ncbi:MAG: hypothetical protein E6579_15120, partial [Clostridium sp.]|nr:hypothetical protein [Clostridium sp.]
GRESKLPPWRIFASFLFVKKGRARPGLRGKPAPAGKLRLHAHREKTCKKNNSLSREQKTSVK